MRITELFDNGEFVVTAEVGPPKGIDASHVVEEAKEYLSGITAVNVTDNQSSVMRMGSLPACVMLKNAGLTPILQLTCRDRNRIALQSELLGAAMLGIDNILCLTVANTSIYADHYGQQTRDDMCIHGDIGIQEFRYAIVPMDGDWQNANLPRRGEVFNRKLPWIVETYHEGPLPTSYSGLSIDAENVSVGALKRAEDGNGYIIRLNETAGKAVKCTIAAPMFGRTIETELGACDIKTLFIPDDASAPVKEVLFTEW